MSLADLVAHLPHTDTDRTPTPTKGGGKPASDHPPSTGNFPRTPGSYTVSALPQQGTAPQA